MKVKDLYMDDVVPLLYPDIKFDVEWGVSNKAENGCKFIGFTKCIYQNANYGDYCNICKGLISYITPDGREKESCLVCNGKTLIKYIYTNFLKDEDLLI